MKKLQIVLGLVAVSAMFLLNSCDPTESTNAFPVIDYDQENPLVLATGVVGTTLTGTIVAEAKLDEVRIYRIVGTSETLEETITSFSTGIVTETDDINYAFRYEVTGLSGETTIKITAVDKDDQEASESIVIQASSVELQAEKTITLGAQENANGSFYASFEGDVYTIGQLEDSAAYGDIDIIYYYGATNKEALFSPKFAVDNEISWSGAVPIADWGTPNETLFKAVTASDYTNATYSSVLELATGVDLVIANGEEDPIDGLDVDDTYIFLTEDGYYGILTVSAVSTGATGTIELKVKVQG